MCSRDCFFFGQSYWMAWVGNSIVNEAAHEPLHPHPDLSLSFFGRNPTGTLISRITNDVNNIQARSPTWSPLVMDLFTVAGLIFVIFYRDWKLVSSESVIRWRLSLYYFGRKLRSLSGTARSASPT
jgi:subfamily B ATP-binding cassette protein MsbA